ncbi:homocysteine S-methyltransferase YbgG isoform X3 [Pleuronectes platessa]|uniref:homocysteine S-methyltransferase YbgG isoform X3 n=1 Tax=Pleuronectes platessa TaxID=8262 RepID=UPI00232A3DA1|nr:homocysteine S-methyltransferase YbgG isoform X3 [Pleuronectes platessa]
MASRLRADMADNQPLILDGGLATELEAQGIHLQGDPLWSARLLQTNPQAIREAHYSFLRSGADVITTATYQASIPGFITHMDVSSECARELLMSGVHLAKESVKRFVSESRATEQKCPLVAGSVGPYGAFLHNGSEYTGEYAEKMRIEELKEWHRPQIGCLAAAGADLIAFETIPSIKEAEALVELLREFPNTKAWLSLSCKDGRCISDGSPFTDAVKIANRSLQLVAVGVNCCSPALVEQLLDSAGSLLSPDMSWVVYPNSGEEWDTEQGWMTPGKASASILELSHTWLKQGAFLIGGCCRIGPAHIKELRQHLKGSCTSAASAERLD